jgi:hypothetical protein
VRRRHSCWNVDERGDGSEEGWVYERAPPLYFILRATHENSPLLDHSRTKLQLLQLSYTTGIGLWKGVDPDPHHGWRCCSCPRSHHTRRATIFL